MQEEKKEQIINTQTENAARYKNNPHDKGYKRIFSIKKNFLDFLKKYVNLEWTKDLTVDDIELIDKEFITDQLCAQQRAINLTGAKPVCLRSNQPAVVSLAW